MEWWERFEKAREALGLTRVDVARATGLSKEVVQKYGTGAIRHPRGDTMEKLAKAVGVTEMFLRYGDAVPNARPAPAVALPPSRSEMPLDIPVLGTGAGSSQGAITLDTGPIDYVRRPPGLTAARDVYAVYVEGDSMEPRYFAGDLVYVSPYMAPKVGDHVVIQCRRNGGDQDQPVEAFVKVITGRNSSGWVYGQYEPKGEFVPPAPVIAVHRIYSWNDLFSA